MAKINFHYEDAQANEPVRIESVHAEKPGGGLLAEQTFEVAPTTAVGKNSDGKYAPIKAYRLAADVATDDTTIKIKKGSGVAANDIIATGKKGVKATAVDTTNEEYDEVTVTLGVVLKAGDVCYQAASASASAAAPIYTPEFVTGNAVEAGNGDHMVRLINGGNLRKETANVSKEIVALLPGIALV